MHEYIKKLSFSLCLIEQIVKDPQFKNSFKQLEMSLIGVASDFLVVTNEVVSGERNLFLRKILVQVVDMLDLAKVGKVVSVMNAEVIISAALRLIEEVDLKLQKQSSYLLPRFSLSEMSDKLLRDRARDEEQSKFLSGKFEKRENEYFNFTKIPELKLSEPEPHKLDDLQDSGVQKNSEENKIDDSKKVADKNEEPRFDWASGNGKSAEPMVYTFFGSEDKIIEDRKSKLLEILKVGGGVAIGEVAKQFPGLNVKTLQRDLLDLMREKKVIMLGKKRWAKYYLK
jgi:hypothetical protein